MTSRRRFLTVGSLTAAYSMLHGRALSAAVPGIPLASDGGRLRSPTDPAALAELARSTLAAATAAGAIYADVRFTVTRQQWYDVSTPPKDREVLAVGVRAIARGSNGWGFVAHTEWTPDVMASLANTAVKLARSATWPGQPAIELGERPTPVVGSWTMPVGRDPFTVSWEEKRAFLEEATRRTRSLSRGASARIRPTFERQTRTFASTDGALTTQTVYTALGDVAGVSPLFSVGTQGEQYQALFVSPRGVGYEVFDDEHALDQIPLLWERLNKFGRAAPLPSPFRFDVVFDGHAMAAMADATLGAAIEADRVMGDEPDVWSYVTPETTGDRDALFPSSITLRGDRSLVGGAATVRWDDEGVAPRDTALIEKGRLVSLSTSRQYASSGGSLGYAASESALTPPAVYTPNLELHIDPQDAPSRGDTSFDELLAGMGDGLAVIGGLAHCDPRLGSGMSEAETGWPMYRVKNGKIVGTVWGLANVFQTREFWKKIMRVGGAQTVAMRGFTERKNAGLQRSMHSVRAPAAHLRNLTIVNSELL